MPDSDRPNDENISELLELLGRSLNEPLMKSTARLTIIIALSINFRLSFKDLTAITSLGKGSLSNHLSKLEEGGLVKTKTVLKRGGPRVYVEITDEGKKVYSRYVEILKRII